MNGKGDKRRPMIITKFDWDRNWTRIFGNIDRIKPKKTRIPLKRSK